MVRIFPAGNGKDFNQNVPAKIPEITHHDDSIRSPRENPYYKTNSKSNNISNGASKNGISKQSNSNGVSKQTNSGRSSSKLTNADQSITKQTNNATLTKKSKKPWDKNNEK